MYPGIKVQYFFLGHGMERGRDRDGLDGFEEFE
jgi:hypothetical protein